MNDFETIELLKAYRQQKYLPADKLEQAMTALRSTLDRAIVAEERVKRATKALQLDLEPIGKMVKIQRALTWRFVPPKPTETQ